MFKIPLALWHQAMARLLKCLPGIFSFKLRMWELDRGLIRTMYTTHTHTEDHTWIDHIEKPLVYPSIRISGP